MKLQSEPGRLNVRERGGYPLALIRVWIRAVFVILAATEAAGAQAVTVLTRDANTAAPVAGALAELICGGTFRAAGTSDENGEVALAIEVGLEMGYRAGGTDPMWAFPNPFLDRTRVPLTVNRTGTMKLTVYDLLGRTVMWRSETLSAGAYQVHLDLSGLSNGHYLLVADFGEAGRSSARLVRVGHASGVPSLRVQAAGAEGGHMAVASAFGKRKVTSTSRQEAVQETCELRVGRSSYTPWTRELDLRPGDAVSVPLVPLSGQPGIALPGAPILVQPIDSALAGAAMVVFAWRPAPDARAYDIEVSSERDFSAPDTVAWVPGDTTMVWHGLESVEWFHWRVRGRNAGGAGPWSVIRSLTLDPVVPDFVNTLGIRFKRIPGGTFRMGSILGEADERPIHSVTVVQDYFIGQYEVTQAEWQAVMGDNPSFFTSCGTDCPVERVSWEDVQAFIDKLNEIDPENVYRLPTEAEWEYAARAGSETEYWFGEEEDLVGDFAWFSGNAGGRTNPVGKKPVNPWGLFDVSGNVWEWVQDGYDALYYATSPPVSPQGPPAATERILRGGSWSFNARHQRSAERYARPPEWRDLGGGLRLVRVDGVTNSIGMQFVRIPGGTFLMGSESVPLYNAEPVHPVTISKDFFLGIAEVTQRQWKVLMGSDPSTWSECPGEVDDDCPVESMTWDEMQTFIERLNGRERLGRYRLPTEAEWEYAARAGTTTTYSFGDTDASIDLFAWYSSNSAGRTHPVAGKLPNPWGLYDVHGNVWEWVADWYDDDYFAVSPQVDPTGPETGVDRVKRGGSWSYNRDFSRSATRSSWNPDSGFWGLGFRLVRKVE